MGRSKEELLKARMKRAVSRQVGNNNKVREELISDREKSLED